MMTARRVACNPGVGESFHAWIRVTEADNGTTEAFDATPAVLGRAAVRHRGRSDPTRLSAQATQSRELLPRFAALALCDNNSEGDLASVPCPRWAGPSDPMMLPRCQAERARSSQSFESRIEVNFRKFRVHGLMS
jgi:hypothetical protein